MAYYRNRIANKYRIPGNPKRFNLRKTGYVCTGLNHMPPVKKSAIIFALGFMHVDLSAVALVCGKGKKILQKATKNKRQWKSRQENVSLSGKILNRILMVILSFR